MIRPDSLVDTDDPSRSKRQRPRGLLSPRSLAMALIVLASLAALTYGLLSNWQELVDHDWNISYWPIATGLLLYPLALGLAVAIWHDILRQLGGRSQWHQDLRIYCASSIARRLPTPIWFVAGRIYLCSEIGVPKSISSLAVLIEGVLILFSGLLVSSVILPISGDMGPIGQHSLRAIPPVLIGLLVIVRPSLLRRLVDWLARRLGRGRPDVTRLDYQHMLLWTALYSAVWIVGGVMLYLLVCAVYPLPIRRVATVIGIWSVAGVVSHLAVITPGGLGIKELTLAVLLSTLTPMPIAIIVSVGARVWFSLNELLWFTLTLLVSGRSTPRRHLHT